MRILVANTALVIGLIQSVLALLAAFGLELSSNQQAAIMGVAGAILAIVGAYAHPKIPIGPHEG